MGNKFPYQRKFSVKVHEILLKVAEIFTQIQLFHFLKLLIVTETEQIQTVLLFSIDYYFLFILLSVIFMQ